MTDTDAVESASQDLPPAQPETAPSSQLMAVEALLREAEGSPDPGEDPAPPDPVETWDIKSVAERLQTDPAKLYDLEIPLADGEKVTLGALKDGFRAARTLETERDEFLKERARHEADRLQNDRELQAFLSVLPREAFTQEVIARSQQAYQEALAKANEQVLREIPEWSDSAVKAEDRKVMAAWTSQFGLSPADVDGVLDSRWQKALRAAAKLDSQVKAAKAEKPPAKVAQAPTVGRKQTPAQELGRLKAAVTMKRIKPVDAVASLLKDHGHGG